MTLPQDAACIRIVDDERVVREAIARLLRAAGFDVATFPSAAVFLRQDACQVPGCVVLDLRMPERTGLELQDELARREHPMPVIFVSGCADVASCVHAMKSGAVDFLTKPLEAEALLGAVRAALERDRALRAARAARDGLLHRLDSLTPREREVLGHLVQGKLNKQIAAELGAAEKTIKVHRARVLHKMAVRSIAALARIAERAGLRFQGE